MVWRATNCFASPKTFGGTATSVAVAESIALILRTEISNTTRPLTVYSEAQWRLRTGIGLKRSGSGAREASPVFFQKLGSRHSLHRQFSLAACALRGSHLGLPKWVHPKFPASNSARIRIRSRLISSGWILALARPYAINTNWKAPTPIGVRPPISAR